MPSRGTNTVAHETGVIVYARDLLGTQTGWRALIGASHLADAIGTDLAPVNVCSHGVKVGFEDGITPGFEQVTAAFALHRPELRGGLSAFMPDIARSLRAAGRPVRNLSERISGYPSATVRACRFRVIPQQT